MRTDERLALGAVLTMAALLVAGFRCGNGPPATPADSSATPTDSSVPASSLAVAVPTPLGPVGGRLTQAPGGSSTVQVSADSAGQVGLTLGPALAPVATASGVRFQLYRAGSTWRWRLVVTASGRVLANSGETYATRAADSVAARTVSRVSSTAPIGN